MDIDNYNDLIEPKNEHKGCTGCHITFKYGVCEDWREIICNGNVFYFCDKCWDCNYTFMYIPGIIINYRHVIELYNQ